MKTIDVCLTPDLLHLYDFSDRTVVVVDILRATSSIVTALACGAREVLTFDDIEKCALMKSRGFIIAGERDGKKIPGFDKGNSPFEFMKKDIYDQRIAFTTTNGTHAIRLTKKAREVLIGSFLNITSIAKKILLGDHSALILCAGWKGRVNLEDMLFAGALVDKLKEYLGPDCDAPLAAQHLYRRAKGDIYGFLEKSSHVQRLKAKDATEDIQFCLTLDKYKIIPKLAGDAIVC